MKYLLIAICFMTSITAPPMAFGFDVAECDSAFSTALYHKFDYWMKRYAHKGTDAEEFAIFPEADLALANTGADYTDYLCVAEVAKENGYKIDWVIRASGYYHQIRKNTRWFQ